ncbi:MAG: acyltransferase [Sandaracinaceae bacterium]|nr:acyltransferase [Sandaracinaceae bacterium]MBK8589558.1 acyltransferase [Sandaracinaceae bacterium]
MEGVDPVLAAAEVAPIPTVAEGAPVPAPTPVSTTAPRGRHAGIELGRAFAMLAVVLVHVPPPAPAASWLRPLAELGVPYFFVVSGYFLGVSRGVGAPAQQGLPAVRGMLRKLLGLYLLGCVVYALVPLDWLSPLRHGELLAACRATLSESVLAFRAAPVARLLDGPPGGFHLWFLPALACGAGLLALTVRLGQERVLLALAVALFVLGLLGGRYADTPLGLALGVNTRNGPFQSTLLVGLGYALSIRGLPLRAPRRGPLVLGFGLLMLWLESAWLRAQLGVLPDDYSVAVLPLGLGAFLCFHDLPRMPARVERACLALGGSTLGVYLWHVLLRVPVASVLGALGLYPRDGAPPVWGFVALFVVSAALVLMAQRLGGACRR